MKGEITTDKIILIVLAVLVLGVLVLMIFKVDLLDRFRNMYGYEYEKGDEDRILNPDALVSVGCEVPVAAIGSEARGIIFGKNSRGMLVYDKEKKDKGVFPWAWASEIYWEGDKLKELKIKAVNPRYLGLGKDFEVGYLENFQKGEIVSKRIKITDFSRVAKWEDKLILARLDGAEILTGTHFFCKSEEDYEKSTVNN